MCQDVSQGSAAESESDLYRGSHQRSLVGQLVSRGDTTVGGGVDGRCHGDWQHRPSHGVQYPGMTGKPSTWHGVYVRKDKARQLASVCGTFHLAMLL